MAFIIFWARRGSALLTFFWCLTVNAKLADSRLICKRDSHVDEQNANLMILTFLFHQCDLQSMNWTRIWWTSRFETSDAGLIHSKTRIWVLTLRNFFKSSSVKFGRGLHISFTFQTIGASLYVMTRVWASTLSVFPLLSKFYIFCWSLQNWKILMITKW